MAVAICPHLTKTAFTETLGSYVGIFVWIGHTVVLKWCSIVIFTVTSVSSRWFKTIS